MTPFFHDDHLTLYGGDCREVLRELPDESVHCVVTSPPYWGLRDYGTAAWEGGDPECDHAQNGSQSLAKLADKYAPNATPRNPNRADTGTGYSAPYKGHCPKCGARRIDSQLGLEATPEEFVANMVGVFREVRRVLRRDGTLWLNLGDSYNSVPSGQNFTGQYANDDGRHGRRDGSQKASEAAASVERNLAKLGIYERSRKTSGLKPKDLVGIPWRVAFALQADGWYLRSDIIWAKPNPMPESVTDRPTKAHEYLFLLTRSPRYFYDAEAVRETKTGNTHSRGTKWLNGDMEKVAEPGEGIKNNRSFQAAMGDQFDVPNRNLRSVWNIATEPYPGAHFATFPRKLVEPCVKAGTSERGVCPECGAPWVRVTDGRTKPEPLGAWLRERRQEAGMSTIQLCGFIGAHGEVNHGGAVANWEADKNIPTADQWARLKDVLRFGDERDALLSAWHDFERGAWGTTPNAMTHGAPSAGPANLARNRLTTGWRPSCTHEAEPVPAVVLDPFAGSGTTLLVAQQLGRRGVGIDLSPDYLKQALERNRQTPLGLVG